MCTYGLLFLKLANCFKVLNPLCIKLHYFKLFEKFVFWSSAVILNFESNNWIEQRRFNPKRMMLDDRAWARRNAQPSKALSMQNEREKVNVGGTRWREIQVRRNEWRVLWILRALARATWAAELWRKAAPAASKSLRNYDVFRSRLCSHGVRDFIHEMNERLFLPSYLLRPFDKCG